jgi:vancomycin resistance protein YoaR
VQIFTRGLLLILFFLGAASGQMLPQPMPVPAAPIEPQNPKTELALELLVLTSEPELRGGRVEQIQSEQRFLFPIASVNRSREQQKLSNGLESALLEIAKKVQLPSLDARFYQIQNQWIAKQRSAWRLDLPATRAVVLSALKNQALTARAVLSSQPPKRRVEDFFKQGIRHYFGGGTSNFSGSPSYRVQNIIAAAKQIDARYLAPKAIFAFNQSITLSAKQGFVLGNIIRGSTLSKELGGGICQVSTTVWRAAYQAGLPILERHQHSYRVAYYDPPGFEATVFASSKNLRFRNDTKSLLWMQLEWDVETGELGLHFFGIRPERQVQISKPRITNEKPAPQDRFVPDKEVKLGEVKIISGAEPGMQTRIDRVVKYNSGRVTQDSTRSRYVPWAAIYAVHPKDKRVRRK